MNEKKISKIHQRVADVLGMEVPDDTELEGVDDTPLVPLPQHNELVSVDNPELPRMQAELERLEHAQRQTEYLLEHALPTITDSLAEIGLMPPIYKARSVEANAKLLDVAREMLSFKAELQLKIIEMRMKMATFTQNRPTTGDITGNTFNFVNREDIIKAYREVKLSEPATIDADDSQ
jgi:hypothetical protein